MQKVSKEYRRKKQTANADRWDKANITRIVIKPHKEEAVRIKEHASKNNSSVQGYILNILRKEMDKEDEENSDH